MDMVEITNFISPIILVACLGVGYTLHTLNNKILNSFLPIISASLGIVAAVRSFGVLDLQTVVTGLISGLASTGLYEALKNVLNLPQTYANAMAIPEIQYGEFLEEEEYDDEEDDLPSGKHFAKE